MSKVILTVIFASFLLLGCIDQRNKQQIGITETGKKNDNYNLIIERIEDSSLTVKGLKINNKKFGFWLTLGSNNNLLYERFYLNDTLHGPFKYYSKEGFLSQKGNYYKGDFHGEYISYYKGGVVADSGAFNLGEKVGVWRYYEAKDLTYNFQGGLSYVIDYQTQDTIVLVDNNLTPPLPDGTPAWKKY